MAPAHFALILILCSLACLKLVESQTSKLTDVRICTTSYQQQSACQALEGSLSGDTTLQSGTVQIPGENANDVYNVRLQCVQANHVYECLEELINDNADIVRVSAEELFGIQAIPDYQSNFVPLVAAETALIRNCRMDCHEFPREFSVAVVKKTSGIKTLADLKDRKACFSQPGSAAGWIIPIYFLHNNWSQANVDETFPRKLPTQRDAQMSRAGSSKPKRSSTQPCPVDLNIAKESFPASCAPGLWHNDTVFRSEFGDSLCAKCNGQCSKYANGDIGALQCLDNQQGDVAFVGSSAINAYFKTKSTSGYQLLCDRGTTIDVMEAQYCHWGVVPELTYVAAQHKGRGTTSSPAIRNVFTQYLIKLFQHILTTIEGGKDKNLYGGAVQFLADNDTIKLKRLDEVLQTEPATAEAYLKHEGGEMFVNAMETSFPLCPEQMRPMRLCVLSSEEYLKCLDMQMAFAAAGLSRANLQCVIGYSEDNCVRMINASQADIAIIMSHRADEYAHDGTLMPIMREVREPGKENYAVAVAITNSEVSQLKDVSSGHLAVCSAGTDSFSGWEAPNHVMKQLGIIDKNDCLLTEKWATLFRQDSCVPGAKNVTVTLGRDTKRPIDATKIQSLCGTCTAGPGQCLTPSEATDDSHRNYDQYYGSVGALRCLLNRKGKIAFLNSEALDQVEYLKEKDSSFRSVQESTFRLLCADGISDMPYNNHTVQQCNLGMVPEKFMVARAKEDPNTINHWQDLWLLAEGRARTSYNWLKTYMSLTPGKTMYNPALIFSNNTQYLQRLSAKNLTKTDIHKLAYGQETDPFECASGDSTYRPTVLWSSLVFTMISVFLTFVVLRL